MKTLVLATAVIFLMGSAMISMSFAAASCCEPGNGAGPAQANSFLPAPRAYAPPQAAPATVRYAGAPSRSAAQFSRPVQARGPVAGPVPSCCAVPNGSAPVQAGAYNTPAGPPGGCGRGCCGGSFTTYRPTGNPGGYTATPVRNVVNSMPTTQRVYTQGVTRRYW